MREIGDFAKSTNASPWVKYSISVIYSLPEWIGQQKPTLVVYKSKTRASSREVRIRVPTFPCSLF